MPYAELHCKTNFSFLEGASHADELVVRAEELGYAALAVTDRESLAGVVRAHIAAKELGLKLLIGAEIQPADAPPVVLWATDRPSYGRLSRLLTVGRRRAEKGECQLTLADIAEHADGLLAGVIGQDCRDCRGSGVQPRPLALLLATSSAIAAICWPSCFAAPTTPPSLERLDCSRQAGPLAAGGGRRRALSRAGPPAAARRADRDPPGHDRRPSWPSSCFPMPSGICDRSTKSPPLFAACRDALHRTLEIAERCTFSLDELRYEYPEELAPPGRRRMEYLARADLGRSAASAIPTAFPTRSAA